MGNADACPSKRKKHKQQSIFQRNQFIKKKRNALRDKILLHFSSLKQDFSYLHLKLHISINIFSEFIVYLKIILTFATANKRGAIAQLVEQRTENPCVPGSIPGGTTFSNRNVAQLVAHYVRDVGVGRSSRLIPTESEKQ